jgi:hypothetical protein
MWTIVVMALINSSLLSKVVFSCNKLDHFAVEGFFLFNCEHRLMEQHIFCIFIDYRGRHRKGAAIYYATYAIMHQKLWFH